MRSKKSFPKLKNPAVLSPMAGVTDVAFRALCKKHGAGLTYTEFINSTGLVRKNKNSLEMLKTDPCEKPVGVQLFGSSVKDVVQAAQDIEDTFDIIDVNCGCPAWKVIKTGAGSELLKKPEGIAKFISKLSAAVSKPVTIKIRSGINKQTINAVDVAKQAENAGAAAIAIHGRTQKQGYSGVADWDIIKKVKESVNIPVIGNGDVTTPEIFKKRMDESGVDAIMIARAAIGNPGIFKQINQYLKTGSYEKDNRMNHFEEFLKLAKKHNLKFSSIKNHAIWFSKGMVGGAKLRSAIGECNTIEEVKSAISRISK